jgi:hypothetical protein
LITIRTSGVAFSYGLHLANNLFGAVVVVSAGDVFAGSPGLLRQNTPGLIWLDVLATVLALAALVWIAARNRKINGERARLPA